MIYSNARKSVYNVLSGLLSQIVMILLGILIPRLVLVNLGSEVNGLLNSVNQVLVYAGLLEAGVGMATTQALYGPLAKQDKTGINRIMSATHGFYKKTGFIYIVVVFCIAVVYPIIVSSTISSTIIFLVIILSGLPNAINFYFQGKYKLLLNADGRSYVITNVSLIVYICTSISKILLLIMGFDVVALQIMYLFFNLVQMIIYRTYVSSNYGWLNIHQEPDNEAISQKKYVMIHQLSGLVFSNTDMICLTMFCGLKVVSVYSMYVLLFGMIGTVIQNVNSGIMFAMGQAYNSDKKKFIPMHDAFELYNMTLTFSLFCIANIFILPFMKLYTSGVTDINYIDSLLPYLFITSYLLENARISSMKVINYAGHFEQTKYHALVEMIINLVSSIVLVNLFGVYGVILGTILALLFRANAMIIYASKILLKRSPWVTYKRWVVNLLLFICITIIAKSISLELSSYVSIFCYAIIYCLVIIPVFFIVNSIIEKKTFKYTFDVLKLYLIKRK